MKYKLDIEIEDEFGKERIIDECNEGNMDRAITRFIHNHLTMLNGFDTPWIAKHITELMEVVTAYENRPK